MARQIKVLFQAHRGLQSLRGKKLGCIGQPSDWLIASEYLPGAVMEKLGLDFVQIAMGELLEEIARSSFQENAYTALFSQQALLSGSSQKVSKSSLK